MKTKVARRLRGRAHKPRRRVPAVVGRHLAVLAFPGSQNICHRGMNIRLQV